MLRKETIKEFRVGLRSLFENESEDKLKDLVKLEIFMDVNNIDVNQQDSKSRTILMAAGAFAVSSSLIIRLALKGADKEIRDVEKRNAFDYAVLYDNEPAAHALVLEVLPSSRVNSPTAEPVRASCCQIS